jgi:LuxR family maltose regulon positive regulatory protein
VGRVAARPAGHLRSWVGSSLELVESKLHPPPPRPGIVARTGLVERLLAADAAPVVCVVAPAGYGKTTLLAQWAQDTAHRVGWVSLDQRDNDPAVLLTYIAAALDRVEPIDPKLIRALAGSVAPIMGVVPRLAAAMAAMTEPVALVLDQLEVLGNQQSLDAVAELAAQLPAGVQLLVASRARPPLPVALLRTQGRVLELGAKELAMDDQEARALLEGAGVGLDEAEVSELLARPRGGRWGCIWPHWPTRRAAALAAAPGPGSPAMTGFWPTTYGRSCWASFPQSGWRF